jgi:hypothetical protein
MFSLFSPQQAARFAELYGDGRFDVIDFKRFSKFHNPQLKRYNFAFEQLLADVGLAARDEERRQGETRCHPGAGARRATGDRDPCDSVHDAPPARQTVRCRGTSVESISRRF